MSTDESAQQRIIELKAQADALLRQAAVLEAQSCTGISASWCPVCGDCACTDREQALDDLDCPLHSPMSIHAER